MPYLLNSRGSRSSDCLDDEDLNVPFIEQTENDLYKSFDRLSFLENLGAIQEVDAYGASILSMLSKQKKRATQLSCESKVIVNETEFEE